MPTKDGNGIIGRRDFGLESLGFGSSINGGGIRCLETRMSWDYSDYIIEYPYSSGESPLIPYLSIT